MDDYKDLINTIEERVHLLIENLVDDGLEVLNELSLKDLKLDSLDKIDLTMDLEDEFDIEIPDEVLQYLEDVEEIVQYIFKRIVQ